MDHKRSVRDEIRVERFGQKVLDTISLFNGNVVKPVTYRMRWELRTATKRSKDIGILGGLNFRDTGSVELLEKCCQLLVEILVVLVDLWDGTAVVYRNLVV